MTIDTVLAIINSFIALGMCIVNYILFRKTKVFFKWVRLMYAFDGAMMFLVQLSAIQRPVAVSIGRGGATLVLTTILCSGLLTLFGGNNDTSQCISTK